MCFPTPIPFANLYPRITNWCDPFTVRVTDLELVGDEPRSGFDLGIADPDMDLIKMVEIGKITGRRRESGIDLGENEISRVFDFNFGFETVLKKKARGKSKRR